VRDQAIDTPIPSFNSFDQLTEQEMKIATLFHAKSVWIFVHMIELRKIAGRILESIYTSLEIGMGDAHHSPFRKFARFQMTCIDNWITGKANLMLQE
jgi:hypothetical protein